jgi:hypothetical protein
MKKLILFCFFTFVCVQVWAQDLTVEQEKQAKELVKNYCALLKELCEKPNDTDTEPILQLCANRRVKTYDDLEQDYKELFIQQYLNKLANVPQQQISIQYENVQTQPIEAVKNCGKIIASLSLSKRISFLGTKRTTQVSNNFYLSWEGKQWKIYGIGREVQENADIESLTPFEVWQKTLKQLGGTKKVKVWKNTKNLIYYRFDNGSIAPLRGKKENEEWESNLGKSILRQSYRGFITEIKFLDDGVAEFKFSKGNKSEKVTYCISHESRNIVFTNENGKELTYEIQKLSNFSFVLKVSNSEYNIGTRNDLGKNYYDFAKAPYWLHIFEIK